MNRIGQNNPMFGRKHSEETKRKIALSRLGKKRQPRSPEWQAKIVASIKGKLKPEHIRAKFRGENNSNWKGGVTKTRRPRESNEYKLWRSSVLTRDKFTCQSCGDKPCAGHPVELHAHHIKKYADFPDLRLDVSNGQTLCIPCHKLTDNYGNKK